MVCNGALEGLLACFLLSNQSVVVHPVLLLQVDSWYGEMADHLRSVDPNHLITTGEEVRLQCWPLGCWAAQAASNRLLQLPCRAD